MITYYLIGSIEAILGLILSIVPSVKIADIPFVGSAISNALITVSGIWSAFLITFPYAQDGWYIFIYGIIPFEILLLTLKVLLGTRTPIHN